MKKFTARDAAFMAEAVAQAFPKLKFTIERSDNNTMIGVMTHAADGRAGYSIHLRAGDDFVMAAVNDFMIEGLRRWGFE